MFSESEIVSAFNELVNDGTFIRVFSESEFRIVLDSESYEFLEYDEYDSEYYVFTDSRYDQFDEEYIEFLVHIEIADSILPE